MSDFDELIGQIKQEIKSLARKHVKKYSEQAIKDGENFLTAMKEDLKEWQEQLSEGKMSSKDVEFLMQGKKDLAKMQGLKHKGLAKIRIQKFQQELFNSIVQILFQ